MSGIGTWFLAQVTAPKWPKDDRYVNKSVTVRLNGRAYAALVALADVAGQSATSLAGDFLEMAIAEARETMSEAEDNGFGRGDFYGLEKDALKTVEVSPVGAVLFESATGHSLTEGK
jgi:hypothetical protein